MNGLASLRGLLLVVEDRIANERCDGNPADGPPEDELLGDLGALLDGADLEQLLALRQRICLGGLRAIDQLLKGMEG